MKIGYLMNIKRIKAPAYKVGRCVLNEYELRNLCVEVAKGEKPKGIKVTDKQGCIAYIKANGTLSQTLYGIDICIDFKMEILRIMNKHLNA
jgi:hypothetical protein